MAMGSFDRAVVLLGWLCFGGVLWAQPDNDHFRNATPLVGEKVELRFFAGDGTVESGEPEHFPKDYHFFSGFDSEDRESVWFTWVAPRSGVAEVQFERFSDHFVAMYRGEELSNLSRVPYGWGLGGTIFLVEAGTKYSIAFATAGAHLDATWELAGRLTLTSVPPPDNDLFANARELSELDPVEGALFAGSVEGQEPNHGGTEDGSYGWKWSPTEDGWANIDIRWMSWFPPTGTWHLYRGDALEALELVTTLHTTNEWVYDPGLIFLAEADTVYHLAWVGDLKERVDVVWIQAELAQFGIASPASGERFPVGSLIPLEFHFPVGNTGRAVLQVSRMGWWSEMMSWEAPFPAGYIYTNQEPEVLNFRLAWQRDISTNQMVYSGVVSVEIPVPHDHFTDALVVEGTNVAVSLEMSQATIEDGEPLLPPGLTRSVWLRWVAPEDGILRELDGWRF